ncbi:MAG: ABC transporter ATP-binding protein [Chloroflexaceae bacterium]|nr:ABC transporter ATP-binding protein [Oscillochloris sp.]NJO08008.1 ABC transporter ATP-binding protein [Chloroflexaceae bacterium]
MPEPILQVENLTLTYRTRAGDVSAVDGVSFSLDAGESLGLVGESGCGKTSVASALLRLLAENGEITRGQIRFKDVDLVALSESQMRRYRWRHIAMVFQAAMNALNPVYTVGEQIIEALEAHQGVDTYAQSRNRVAELFTLVGLEPRLMDRYPHEYSGGMRQRAVIAMALACNPDIIVADEPTTALDVIVQDNLLRELKHLQQKIGMSMIYISHDIAVIAEVSDRIGVMYAGRIVELARADAIFHTPHHPYTNALMHAFPSVTGPKRPLISLAGEAPNLLHPPAGCRFHPRCALATNRCRNEVPPLVDHGDGHRAACWHPLN